MPDSDSGTKLHEAAIGLRRAWFNGLPYPEQDRIIEQEFNKQYPRDADKRKVVADLQAQPKSRPEPRPAGDTLSELKEFQQSQPSYKSFTSTDPNWIGFSYDGKNGEVVKVEDDPYWPNGTTLPAYVKRTIQQICICNTVEQHQQGMCQNNGPYLTCQCQTSQEHKDALERDPNHAAA